VMIRLREYRPDDYMSIKRRHFDAMTFLNFPDPMSIAINLNKGPAYTLVNEEIIASGGILPLWKGVGEGWIVSSPLVEKYPIAFAKTLWRKMLSLYDELGLERLQTLVDAEHIVSQKWLERMGFENEGLMRKYLNGRDFYRYALIKEK
jgi:hypothetical protein